MTDAKVTQASKRAHALDDASQVLRDSAKKKWNRALISAIVAFFILLLVGVGGILYQNQIARENKKHIDCIIKLSETPLPPNERAKFIDNLNNTCQIKFVQ